MSSTTDGAPSSGSGVGPRGQAMRQRILESASELFYAHGLRAVSADRIVERAGITKVTFYRHFPTKDDLIVAYLQRRAEWERAGVSASREAGNGDVVRGLRFLADGIGSEAFRSGFRGCPFINAAAEYADPAHPVRGVVAEHRAWFRRQLLEMLLESGVDDPERAADQLVMLRDGAMVDGYLGGPTSVGESLGEGFAAVVAAHSRS